MSLTLQSTHYCVVESFNLPTYILYMYYWVYMISRLSTHSGANASEFLENLERNIYSLLIIDRDG